MSVRVQFELGHVATVKSAVGADGYTHDWEMSVRGVDGADISQYIEKVVFMLHDSFPKPRRVLKEPPYAVKESGWAGFTLPVEIYFRSRDDPKKLSYKYDLSLQKYAASSNTDRKTHTFRSPSDDFRRKLLRGGGIAVEEIRGANTIAGPSGSSSTASAAAANSQHHSQHGGSSAYASVSHGGSKTKPSSSSSSAAPATGSSSSAHGKYKPKSASDAPPPDGHKVSAQYANLFGSSSSGKSSSSAKQSPDTKNLKASPSNAAAPAAPPAKSDRSASTNSSSGGSLVARDGRTSTDKPKSDKSGGKHAPSSPNKKKTSSDAPKKYDERREDKRKEKSSHKDKDRDKERKDRDKSSSSKSSTSTASPKPGGSATPAAAAGTPTAPPVGRSPRPPQSPLVKAAPAAAVEDTRAPSKPSFESHSERSSSSASIAKKAKKDKKDKDSSRDRDHRRSDKDASRSTKDSAGRTSGKTAERTGSSDAKLPKEHAQRPASANSGAAAATPAESAAKDTGRHRTESATPGDAVRSTTATPSNAPSAGLLAIATPPAGTTPAATAVQAAVQPPAADRKPDAPNRTSAGESERKHKHKKKDKHKERDSQGHGAGGSSSGRDRRKEKSSRVHKDDKDGTKPGTPSTTPVPGSAAVAASVPAPPPPVNNGSSGAKPNPLSTLFSAVDEQDSSSDSDDDRRPPAVAKATTAKPDGASKPDEAINERKRSRKESKATGPNNGDRDEHGKRKRRSKDGGPADQPAASKRPPSPVSPRDSHEPPAKQPRLPSESPRSATGHFAAQHSAESGAGRLSEHSPSPVFPTIASCSTSPAQTPERPAAASLDAAPAATEHDPHEQPTVADPPAVASHPVDYQPHLNGGSGRPPTIIDYDDEGGLNGDHHPAAAEADGADYMTELRNLQHKIMTLSDNSELQHIVDMVVKTGMYEVNSKTFDFDLCALDRRTVQRLQDYLAVVLTRVT